MDKYQEMYERYVGLMSIEFKEGIVGYEKLSEVVPLPEYSVREGAIKVVFKDNSWIRVYEVADGSLEWY